MLVLPPRFLVAIVEDDLAVLDSLQLSLESEGYAVCAFESAAKALGSALIDDADCLVVDYGLPELDGVGLIQALRRRDNRTPAVIVAGDPNLTCQRKADAAGLAVLEKPFRGDALSRQIRAMLPPAPRGRGLGRARI